MASQDLEPIQCPDTGRKLKNLIHREIRKDPTPDLLSIQGVSPRVFEDAYNIREKQRRRYRFDYDEESESLFVRVPTEVTEKLAHIYLYHLHARLRSAKWSCHGIADQRGTSSTGYKGLKQAAVCGVRRLGSPHRKLMLILETGYSQELGFLRRSMRRWFDLFVGGVKIVLLIYVDLPGEMIHIERWEPLKPGEQQQHPSDKILTPPKLKQAICISRQSLDGHCQYTITGGNLVLGFAELHLREPESEGEKDVIVTTEELQDWAGRFWEDYFS